MAAIDKKNIKTFSCYNKTTQQWQWQQTNKKSNNKNIEIKWLQKESFIVSVVILFTFVFVFIGFCFFFRRDYHQTILPWKNKAYIVNREEDTNTETTWLMLPIINQLKSYRLMMWSKLRRVKSSMWFLLCSFSYWFCPLYSYRCMYQQIKTKANWRRR